MDDVALAGATEDFLASLAARGRPPATIKAYRSDLGRFARRAPARLAAVAVGAVETFVGDETVGPATRRRRQATLRSFFKWAARQELVDRNPMDRLDPVVVPDRLPRPLTEAAVRAVLDAIPARATRDRTLFTLLYETGMRVGEALALDVHDLDLTLDDEQVRVTGKGGRERTVLLTAAPQSIRLPKRHLKASQISAGAIFRGDARRGGTNEPMAYTTARRAWRRYCAVAGVAATIHQLRHSRATELVRAGVPVTTIRKVLGHRNLQSTNLYAEVDQATIKRDLLAYRRRTRR